MEGGEGGDVEAEEGGGMEGGAVLGGRAASERVRLRGDVDEDEFCEHAVGEVAVFEIECELGEHFGLGGFVVGKPARCKDGETVGEDR